MLEAIEFNLVEQDDDKLIICKKFEESQQTELVTITKEELTGALIKNPLFTKKQHFTSVVNLLKDLICDGHPCKHDYKFFLSKVILTWGKDILHYDENKEEDCNEMQNIISDYLFPDSTPENQTHNYPQSITSTLSSELFFDENNYAPFFSLYNQEQFNLLYHNMSSSDDNSKKIQNIKRKLEGGPVYVEYTPELISSMTEIFKNYPNFEKLKKFILPDMNLLSIKNDNIIRLPNILLYSKPGCGKSSLIQKLCEIYKYSIKVAMGNGNVCFTLTGSDKNYTPSDCGSILKSMFSRGEGPVLNPFIIFDELDKANFIDRRDTDFSGFFAELLEKNNAKHFVDNFFQVEVDASNINYIALANDISKIPDFILSRFPVKIEIQPYTEEELKSNVLDNLYKEWIKENNIKENCVPESLENQTRDLILECCHNQTREIDNVLTEIAKATIRIKDNLIVADFKPTEAECIELKKLFCTEKQRTERLGFRI